jgi:two-component system KDP operon response regulator KdpE
MSTTNVLVVDDAPTIRAILRQYLCQAGYDVYEAGSGAEALMLARAYPIGMVVTDFILPDMLGTEIIARLRQSPRYAAATMVLVSGEPYDSLAAACRAGGPTFTMEKPICLSQLLALLPLPDAAAS